MKIVRELLDRRISVHGKESLHEQYRTLIRIGKPVKVLESNMLSCGARLLVRQEEASLVDDF
jgi:hypothetical protein